MKQSFRTKIIRILLVFIFISQLILLIQKEKEIKELRAESYGYKLQVETLKHYKDGLLRTTINYQKQIKELEKDVRKYKQHNFNNN